MRRFTALLDKFQPRVHSTVLLVKTDTVSVLVKTFSLRRMGIIGLHSVHSIGYIQE